MRRPLGRGRRIAFSRLFVRYGAVSSTTRSVRRRIAGRERLVRSFVDPVPRTIELITRRTALRLQIIFRPALIPAGTLVQEGLDRAVPAEAACGQQTAGNTHDRALDAATTQAGRSQHDATEHRGPAFDLGKVLFPAGHLFVYVVDDPVHACLSN